MTATAYMVDIMRIGHGFDNQVKFAFDGGM
jgi:hypothetical protein